MVEVSAMIRSVAWGRNFRRSLAVALFLAWGISVPVSSHGDEKSADARPKGSAVDFSHDVAPIFQKRCAKCHAGTQKKGGFSINNRQTLQAGGDGGPAVVLKRSAESELIDRVSSEDPALRMPPEGERLTPAQIDVLRRWIDEGLVWEDGFAFGKSFRQAPLAPRRPEVPDTLKQASLSNPVDRFLARYFAEQKVDTRGLVTDAVFARRAFLDLIGLPPTAEELAEFTRDSRPDKHGRLVDRLLDNRPAYAAHWLTFWNDLLRNAYHGTGFIDGGRQQITGWLYRSLYDNKPYNQFVHELVQPAAGSGSEGFIYGIKWRGTVNESQRREIQAAQSVSQVFLGTNLKCASCHDSFVNHWKLAEAYALASVFSDAPLQLHRCDQPTGVPSTTGFLYPQLGEIDAGASRDARLGRLADLIVDPQNGRFPRTIVNRLWSRLFGRGLVEPVDNMDAEPWHQDLLDFLASDLADHGYDVKRTLRLLAGSQAYRLPGVGPAAEGASDEFVFRGPFVKRMLAEQFVDSVFALTGTWPAEDASMTAIDGRGQGGQLGAIAKALAAAGAAPERVPLAEARWIWSQARAEQAAPPATIYLRRVWNLESRPAGALAIIAADNHAQLIVNGLPVGKCDDWTAPVQVDVTGNLIAGKNVIAIVATNDGESPNPAGAIGEIVLLSAEGKRIAGLSTDDSWSYSTKDAPEWYKADFDASGWKKAAALGDAALGPWNMAARVAQKYSPLPSGFRIRASLMPLDALQAALGRPNREQVVSSRDAAPTMLQALELTNGTSLRTYLQQGAANWHRRLQSEGKPAIDAIYLAALNRPPTDAERRLAWEFVGAAPTVDGTEDLLWMICMYPEFQLVP
jgi:hypothetical protein